MNPDSINAQSSRRSPSARRSAFDTTTAPPDSARSLPITVPRAITMAIDPERVAHASLERARNVRQRHAGGKADKQRRNGEREKRRNTRPGDQQDDEGDADGCDEEKGGWIDWSHGG